MMLNHSPMKEFLRIHNFLVIWHNTDIKLGVYKSVCLKCPWNRNFILALKY